MMLGAHLISSGRKFQSEAAAVSINLFPNLTVLLRFGIGYEPAGLTVHPPPRMIESGFIFFVWVSSATKISSSKKKWIL